MILPRIYLDNAATSWPKPDSVYAAIERAMRELGAPAGRSAYAEAAEVEQAILGTRKEIAALVGTDDPRRIVFTLNGTDSLNLAIHGVLRPDDRGTGFQPVRHVITTVAEHNSVLRPLRALEDAKQIEVTRVRCDAEGFVDPDDVRAALRPSTRLIAMTHASNVTGAVQPAAEVGAIARRHGCLFLLDAAQTLGDVPIDAAALNVDLLAAPGHKGLLGPLGTGVLYVRPGVEASLASLRQGGTGSRSDDDRQPDFLPDKYESGNLNVPGILGLGAGVAYLRERGPAAIREHVVQLTQRLKAGLSLIQGVTIHGPQREKVSGTFSAPGANQCHTRFAEKVPDTFSRVGIVSINIAGFDPQEVAASLDAARRVQVRAGIHCAPRMHESLGTLAQGGTVRFSIGPFNSEADIDAALSAVAELAAAGR